MAEKLGHRPRDAGRTGEPNEDSVHLDLSSLPGLQTSPHCLPPLSIGNAEFNMLQGPFCVTSDKRSRNSSYSNDPDRQSGGCLVIAEVYSSSVAGSSTASLIGQYRGHFEHEDMELGDGRCEDDEARLTANMSVMEDGRKKAEISRTMAPGRRIRNCACSDTVSDVVGVEGLASNVALDCQFSEYGTGGPLARRGRQKIANAERR